MHSTSTLKEIDMSTSTSSAFRPASAGKTQLRAHQGNSFIIIANTYPTLELVLCENVQNALDAGATRIRIEVDYRQNTAITRDNGGGATKRRIADALSQIGRTQKKEDALGRFGIGVISPLGKCRVFTFTACCPPEGFWGYMSWPFVTDAIQNTSGDVELEMNFERSIWNMKNPTSKASYQTAVWWTAQMKMEGLRPETEIGKVTIDSLKKALLDRFSVKMRNQHTKVEMQIIEKNGEKHFQEVTAREYAGQPLPVIVLENPDAGRVRFRLFIAPRSANGKRNGVVCVGESGNDFRFPIRTFRSSITRAMKPEVLDALRDGTLEGEISGEKVVLKRDREAFEQNDALLGFCTVLEEWHEKYGAAAVEEARERGKDERFQYLGLQALEKLLSVLDLTPGLRSAIDMFKLGTIGIGHTDVNHVVGTQETKSLSVQGHHGTQKSGGKDDAESNRPRQEPEKEKQKHRPPTVAGPNGRHRTIVSKGSLGLQISFDGMGESLDLWRLEAEYGILRFNSRHDLWIACEERNDKYLVELQVFVAIQALTLQLQPEPMRTTQRKVLDSFTDNQVKGWILNSNRYDGAIKSGKKKKTAAQIVSVKP